MSYRSTLTHKSSIIKELAENYCLENFGSKTGNKPVFLAFESAFKAALDKIDQPYQKMTNTITVNINDPASLIKQLREQQGMTQQAFGDLFGKTRQYISNIETGQVKIGLNLLLKIAAAVGVEISLTTQSMPDKATAGTELENMHALDLETLSRGDIIRHQSSGTGYVVLETTGKFAIAVNHVVVSNPSEWLVYQKPKAGASLSDGVASDCKYQSCNWNGTKGCGHPYCSKYERGETVVCQHKDTYKKIRFGTEIERCKDCDSFWQTKL